MVLDVSGHKFVPEHKRIIDSVKFSKLSEAYLASDILEVVNKFDTLIAPATVETLKAAIDSEGDYTVKTADDLINWHADQKFLNLNKVKGSLFSETADSDPAIIIANGASFCTCLCLFDQQGVARLLHKPMFDDADILHEEIAPFFNEPGKFDQDTCLLVTSTNVDDLTGNLPDYQGDVVDIVQTHPVRQKNFTSQQITTLFVKKEYSRYLGSQASASYQSIEDVDGSFPKGNNISGVIFIPKNIARNGCNNILIINKEKKSIFDGFFMDSDIQKILFKE